MTSDFTFLCISLPLQSLLRNDRMFRCWLNFFIFFKVGGSFCNIDKLNKVYGHNYPYNNRRIKILPDSRSVQFQLLGYLGWLQHCKQTTKALGLGHTAMERGWKCNGHSPVSSFPDSHHVHIWEWGLLVYTDWHFPL